MFCFVGTVHGDADVGSLLRGEPAQVDADALQVEPCHLLVELLRQTVDVDGVRLVEQLDLCQRLVGERVANHERGVSRRAAQVHQTAIGEQEITEITRQDQKPPEQPKKVEVKVIADLLQVVTNDTKITTEVDFAEFDENTEVVQQVEVVEETIEDDQPFLIAETMPSFQGGDLNTFRNWVQQNVRFPQIALENGNQGREELTFVIEKDGRLTNIEVLQTPDRSLSEEAIRVLNMSPKWSPGKQRNQPVRVKYTLPVDFRGAN